MFCTGGPARPPVVLRPDIGCGFGCESQAEYITEFSKLGGRNFGKDTIGNEKYHQNIPRCKGP